MMGLLILIATMSQSSLSTRREGEEGESKSINTKKLKSDCQ